ncbi:MAG: FeoA family protein [Candidatus Caldatribacteriota bacterium]|nr:FeoA family protein [Candidatus Caldatribacteriota bacterium]
MKRKLSEMNYEEEGRVESIEQDLKNKVAGMGIRVGKNLKMITKHPMKGPMVIEVDGAHTSLALSVADRIIMEVKR